MGVHKDSGVWLASVNQFIIVRADSGAAASMLRAGMNGGMSSMMIPAPVDIEPCDLGGWFERDGVSMRG